MYTSVEDLIIKPHERFPARSDYPRYAIFCHSDIYFRRLESAVDEVPGLQRRDDWQYTARHLQRYSYQGMDFVLNNARTSAKDMLTDTEKQYLWGVRRIINIGSSGAVKSALTIGDIVVGDRAIRDTGIDLNLATLDEPARSSQHITEGLWNSSTKDQNISQSVVKGDVWSVANLYYTRQKVAEVRRSTDFDVASVEMEMAAFCVMAGWLNANYGSSRGELEVGSLFYISDVLPNDSGESWKDTINHPDNILFKSQVLFWAINTLAAAHESNPIK